MSSRRGNDRENRVRDYYADAGWFAICGRASRGPADVVACKAGVIHLTQVKSDKAGPYGNFRPTERRLLVETAAQAGGTAHLAWWPPYAKAPQFIPWHEWPQPKEAAA